MKYDKNNIHSIIFLLCIAFYLVSPKMDMQEPVQTVYASDTLTQTGKVSTGMVAPIQTHRKDNKQECDYECKLQNLKDIGIIDEIAESLMYNCKEMADDPVNCIKIGAFIVQNESSGGKNCKKSNKYNCFGLSVKENYKSYNDSTMHWVAKYNKFWYNQRNPDSFYSNSPNWKPKTHYCMSEVQQNGKTLPYCPNGHKNSWTVYNKLKF